MKTIQEMIKVMQAYENGAIIEGCVRSSEEWREYHSPMWNWVEFDYRVKPQAREFSVVLNNRGRPIGIASVEDTIIPVNSQDVTIGSSVIKVREIL